MAAIEQRRVMSRAEAKFRRPVRFPATVSPVGWAFALLALGQLVIRVQPLLAPGALDAPRWGDDARLLEWEIVLPDEGAAESAARSLADAGHTVEPADGAWTAADPWGTRLRLTLQK